jgi:hypothetical protein
MVEVDVRSDQGRAAQLGKDSSLFGGLPAMVWRKTARIRAESSPFSANRRARERVRSKAKHLEPNEAALA